MATRRGLRRRAHDRKRRYTRDEAERAAHRSGMEAYRCAFCSTWHVGHRSRNPRRLQAEDARAQRPRSPGR
jgi:hypothetical protein